MNGFRCSAALASEALPAGRLVPRPSASPPHGVDPDDAVAFCFARQASGESRVFARKSTATARSEMQMRVPMEAILRSVVSSRSQAVAKRMATR